MNRDDWIVYLRKQKLRDLKDLAKKLGIYIKSNTKKNDCIEMILDAAPETITNASGQVLTVVDNSSCLNNDFSINAQINQLDGRNEMDYMKANEAYGKICYKINNSQNLVCSICNQMFFNSCIICDVCYRQFHNLCVGYDEKIEINKNQLMVFIEEISKRERKNIDINSLKFVCPFCRFIALDPYNNTINPLFFTTFYSYTAIHNIHPKHGNINFSNSSHIPQFTSKFSLSPKMVFGEKCSDEISSKDGLIIYCLRLDKMDLNHEFPRLLSVKVNHKVVQNIESPSYDHIRRDCPIDLRNFIISNNLISKTSINITFNTLNALFQEDSVTKQCLLIPTAPFIIGLFHTRSINSEEIINSLISRRSISFEISKNHFRNIIENKFNLNDIEQTAIDDSQDDIVCLNKDQSLNVLCPLTMDKIELPARGYFCKHINCFDLRAFIEINSTIKAFNTRWKCPYCYYVIRPSMLIIDNFVKSLISDQGIQKDNKILINSSVLDKTNSLEQEPIEVNDVQKSTHKQEDVDFKEISSSGIQNYNNIKIENEFKFEQLNSGQLHNNKIEVIDISDDDEEANSLCSNSISKSQVVQEHINMNSEVVEDPYSEYILKTLSVQSSSEIEEVFTESSKKRRVFFGPPSRKSSNENTTSSSCEKVSLSLKL
ncbi:hypothetical protein FG386_002539 [Cryptosporidium ryanae]|uniref:uncharacterized protein n=1 Tax=Cryptosporidium ryanae TaxID=515981 RepID=UPI00351A86A1|nr:hypothetical protein FG386_002539 [Cryptosporidium ryanae]